ncbi:MAG: TIGR00266 family protein [Fimbriimonadaceae bacterium]|nr:MAG: TIGR00266 family protein [Fimbriimonadaceae bacterium]
MQHEILFKPEFAVARIMLEASETIRAESGSMMSMSANVHLDSKISGGLGKMFGRLLTGESAFQTTFTAQNGPGEVILAPGFPGDIVQVDVSSRPLIVTSGAFLAGDVRLDYQTQASMKGFFGGEGMFMSQISGPGLLLLSSYGAIHPIELAGGQPYIVDTGHLVAFSAGMGYNLRKATRSLIGSVTSGEGIVAEMVGPGTVYTQTRTLSALIAMMPTRG